MALVLARAPFLKRGASQQRSDAALSALRERQRWTSALGDGRCGVDLEDPAYKGTGAVIDLLRDRAFPISRPHRATSNA